MPRKNPRKRVPPGLPKRAVVGDAGPTKPVVNPGGIALPRRSRGRPPAITPVRRRIVEPVRRKRRVGPPRYSK